jgi:hypothetical protein
MLVLCKVVGAGLQDDPYRCNFPTHTLIAIDYATLTAIADVRSEDLPAGARTRTVAGSLTEGKPLEVLDVAGVDHAAWAKQLRERYPDTHGRWTPADALAPVAALS